MHFSQVLLNLELRELNVYDCNTIPSSLLIMHSELLRLGGGCSEVTCALASHSAGRGKGEGEEALPDNVKKGDEEIRD
jgi:hypothetical protein